MKGLRAQVGILAIAGVSVAAGFFGYNAIENVQFARAEQQVEATRQQLGTVEDMATVFRHVGKAVEPSVVKIEVTKKMKGMGHMAPDDLLRHFFPDRNGDGQPDLPQGFGDQGDQAPEIMGTGSGVIMEASGGYGYILTNNHVAGGAEKMQITLADGRVLDDATLVGADPKTDIAVVKVKADRLIPAKWGNSDELQQGDWIMAFGAPFGYVGSMTHGIVSALHRTDVGILGAGGYENFIQVDAPINPGNSGGPLVNIRGEVVGINTAIASRSGGFQGIGFAVPSNQAKYIYQALKEHGKVQRGWLGVSIRDVKADLDVAKSFGYQGQNGAIVQETFPNTPATGKLQAGDVITAVNGKNIEDAQALRNVIANLAPGQEAKMTVFRDGKTQDVSIKLGTQPADILAATHGEHGQQGEANAGQGTETLGMTLQSLTPDLAQQAGVTGLKSGAVVTAVKPNSAAAKKGIRPGDVITKINGTSVNSAEDATKALSKADASKGVRLYVASQDGSRFVFVKPEKADTSQPNTQE